MEVMSRNLEVTVLSAENLRLDKKPVKKNAFVVVKIDNLNNKSTNADYKGGCNPAWNEKLVMNMPMQAPFIGLEVKCRTSSGDRVIGTASIPVSDFVGDYTPENYLHLLSYRLRDARGERNGIINVSVRLDGPIYTYSSCSSAVRKNNATKYQNSTAGFSMCQQPALGVPVGAWQRSPFGGVVIGVPAGMHHVARA